MKQRKPTRLKQWDYASPHVYHVTICTKHKQNLHSNIRTNGFRTDIELTSIGKQLDTVIAAVADENPDIEFVDCVIMPNHVHLLVRSKNSNKNIANIIGMIKSRTTKLARTDEPSIDLWQRGFYDHIIRGEKDYLDTIEYIQNNPAKWAEDEYFN